jgi:hypothetical protein
MPAITEQEGVKNEEQIRKKKRPRQCSAKSNREVENEVSLSRVHLGGAALFCNCRIFDKSACLSCNLCMALWRRVLILGAALL